MFSNRADKVLARFKQSFDREEYAHEEWDEYDATKAKDQFPDAFEDEADFVAHVTAGPMADVRLWHGVQNTDADGQRPGDYVQLCTTMWQNKGANFADYPEFQEWLGTIISSVKDGSAPPSIIGVHNDGTYYLIAGNSRAMAAKFLGVSWKVIFVPLKGRHLPPPTAR